MKVSLTLLVVIACAILIGVVHFVVNNSEDVTPIITLKHDCPQDFMQCHAVAGDIKIDLRLLDKPVYLKPVPLQISIEGLTLQEVQAATLQFNMQGMQMFTKLNKIALLEQGNKLFGKLDVVIPVCSSGRQDWLIQLNIRTATRIYQLEIKREIAA